MDSRIDLDSEGVWYLVQCKAREGFKAEQHLSEQGFTCFHPVQWRRKRIVGQRPQAQLESMFPFYLFLFVGHGQSLASVRSTRGVLKLVAFGGLPLQVSPQLVADLRQCCQALATPPAEQVLQPGDRVSIQNGPFSELEAIVHCAKANDRVVLLLNLLGRDTKIELERSQVESLANRAAQVDGNH